MGSEMCIRDRVFTARYGICYMFNPAGKGDTSAKLVSNYGGPSFGLELILDIEIKYFAFLNRCSTHSLASNMFVFSFIKFIFLSLGLYFMRNGLTKTNGIHLVIEDREKSPSILSNGISVKPGSETNIGLKISTISRLEAPFASKCMRSYLFDALKHNTFLSFFDYSAKNCKSWCHIGRILKVCNCFEHTLMEGIVAEQFVSWKEQSNLTHCDQRSGSPNYECVRNLLFAEDQEALTKECFCGAECNETEYKVIILYITESNEFFM